MRRLFLAAVALFVSIGLAHAAHAQRCYIGTGNNCTVTVSSINPLANAVLVTGPTGYPSLSQTIPPVILQSPTLNGELYGAYGGAMFGQPTGGYMGIGTLNLSGGVYVNGVAVGGGGSLPTLTNGQILGNATGGSAVAQATNLVAGSNTTITATGGNITIASSGTGGVSGPGITVLNDLACWNSTVGAVLSDCSILNTNVVTLTGTQTLTNKSIPASNVNSGTLAAAQMPALSGGVTSSAGSTVTVLASPTASTLGGVEAFIPTANNFMTGISLAGVPQLSTIAFTNLTGSPSAAQLETNFIVALNAELPPVNGSCIVGNSVPAWTVGSCGGGSSAFSALTGGTNTAAAMIVGSGASLATTGSGTIAATSMPASGLTGQAAVANGGTGLASLTAGTIPMGAGTGAFAASEITDVGSGGITVGSPTGGQKGPGTINMTGCFINNVACASGGSTAFSAITGGTNASAAMLVGTGASLAASGSGTIAATSAPASGLTGTTLAASVVSASIIPTAAQLETNLDAAFYANYPPTSGDCFIGSGASASFTTCPAGSSGISGLTTGQLGVAGSATTLTSSIPYGLIGNSTIVETTTGGLLTASLLPLPTASTLGGIESLASTSHEWINAISTAGVPSATQPGFADLSGSASSAQISPNLGAAVSTLCSASTTNFVRGDGTCVAPSGGTTTITAAPGLGNSLTSFNGTGAAQTVTNASTLYPQASTYTVTAAYSLNATTGTTPCTTSVLCDLARTILANGSATLAVTAPNPAGTLGAYQIADIAGHGFTVPTVGGTATFFGCVTGSPTTLTVPANYGVQLFDQGSTANTYLCTFQPLTQVAAGASLSANNVFTGSNTFGEVIGGIRSYSGTTDTLAATDCGLTVHSTGASAAAETVPNSLPAGCNIAIEAIGAGAVTVSAGSSATQHSPCATVVTNHQYAILWIHVESNAGSAAVYDATGGCT